MSQQSVRRFFREARRKSVPELAVWPILGLWNFIVPHRCCCCAVPVGERDSLCQACYPVVRFIDGARCDSCGIPLSHDLKGPQFCAACTSTKPPWTRAQSLVVYDEGSKEMVLGYKRSRRYDVSLSLANWMTALAKDLIGQSDVVVPVPLHFLRLAHRRFNQSALLAKNLSAINDITYLPDSLRKIRSSPSQLGKTAKQRTENVHRRLFRVPNSRKKTITGKRVLLVDDVLTTGATARACTRTLLSAGASNVDLLTIARAERPATMVF